MQSTAQSLSVAARPFHTRVARAIGARPWLWIHIASLAAAAVLLLWAARSQWFFFDDWDFLVGRTEWALFAPHNGHLSLAPALLTTLVKGVVGLSSYWPYLLITIAIHLANAHVLWRVMMRVRVHGAVATVIAFTFVVLAAGAENSLWAFQAGFIGPLLLGSIAILIADGPALPAGRLAPIAVLLAAALLFSSTAIPIVIAVLVLVWVRHGWVKAALAAAPAVILYGAWYLEFARTPSGASSFRAANFVDVLVRVPEYVGHEFVDGLAATLPFQQLAPVLVVAIGGWTVLSLRRGIHHLTIAHYFVLAAAVFSLLIAFTRVQLGVESAAAGRYVYVLYFLLAPAAGLAITAVAARSRLALVAVTALLAVVAGYNAGLFVVNANNQAALEQATRRAVAAAVVLGRDGDYPRTARPLPVIAPQLQLGDILDFVARGQLPADDSDESALLSTQANLELFSNPVAGLAPVCEPTLGESVVALAGAERMVFSQVEQRVDVLVERGGVRSQYVQIEVAAGNSVIEGLDGLDLHLTPTSANSLCADHD